MPFYDYVCVKCGHKFEKMEPMLSKEKHKCPKCGSETKRAFSAPVTPGPKSGPAACGPKATG